MLSALKPFKQSVAGPESKTQDTDFKEAKEFVDTVNLKSNERELTRLFGEAAIDTTGATVDSAVIASPVLLLVLELT